MCLAIPATIIELEGDKAVADAMGNCWHIRTTLVPDARVGDIVLVHAGFAITTIDPQEAALTWELFEQIEQVRRQEQRREELPK